MIHLLKTSVAVLILVLVCSVATAQTKSIKKSQKNKKKNPPAEFKWVTPSTKWFKEKLPLVKHSTFESKLVSQQVGYCIYLPQGYGEKENNAVQYPVVYYLHGGRPGKEWKSAHLVTELHKHISAKKVAPMIYVFVNGGPVSHYNVPGVKGSLGADVFIKELIPHVDATYRTIADRSGRGIEGFSQGGRGTARLAFRYPQLEKRISENGGQENKNLVFAEGDNTWDLAKAYADSIAADPKAPRVNVLVHVGDKGFNYQNNLQWMKYLDSLNIKHQSIIAAGAGHNARQIYAKHGLEIMKFHATNFGK